MFYAALVLFFFSFLIVPPPAVPLLCYPFVSFSDYTVFLVLLLSIPCPTMGPRVQRVAFVVHHIHTLDLLRFRHT